MSLRILYDKVNISVPFDIDLYDIDYKYADEKDKKVINHKVFVLTAGAPPTSAILEKMDNLGFEVMHVYGLTETYGHILQCAWNEEWNELPKTEKADINSRQGVRYPNTEEVIVADPESHKRVPMDGKTMGEILIRGNVCLLYTSPSPRD